MNEKKLNLSIFVKVDLIQFHFNTHNFVDI